jgi:fructose PTS system EIIA component
MDFTEVLRPQIINLYMEAGDKKEVIDKLSDLLISDEAITSKEVYINDVMLRETEGPTGIGSYIAIPHGKSSSVVKISVAMARLKEPIEWETLDDEPVRIVFLFAVPDKDPSNQHLKLLSKLAAVLAHSDSQQLLLEAETVEEVIHIFKSKQTSI